MWMVRLTAAAGVLLAGGGFGERQAKKLSRKRQALQDAVLLLRRLQIRLKTGGGLWSEEVCTAAGDGGFQVLRFSMEIPDSLLPETFAQWYVRRADTQGLLGDAAQLLQAALICAVTREETISQLDYYSLLLLQRLDACRQQEERDKKLYRQLGWLGGALLAVILW